jgi:dTDP-4-amino-4,6-dideoxygalactose transaminase
LIPFSPPYIDDDIINEVVDSLRSGWITSGPKVKALEEEVSRYVGVPDVLCVNSATSAMMLVLHWFGVTGGDEVIIPAYTYAATALAVIHLGAVPVMVDIKDDFCMDTAAVEAAITERTKVIVPVDLGGYPCDYDRIKKIAVKNSNLFKPRTDEQKKLGRCLIMADAAHSIGARYKEKPVALCPDIAVFSFHAVKNVTTSEGGAICLSLPPEFSNSELKAWLKLISLNGQTKDAFTKTLGSSWRYDIVYPGFKINMPDICAAIGLAQLKKYDESLLNRRKEIFDYYSRSFSKFGWAILPPGKTEDRESSYHVYLLRIKDISEEERDRIIDEIYKRGVSVNVHFVPLPMLTAFKEKGFDIAKYPQSYKNYSCEITLPLYPQLTKTELDKIIFAVAESYKQVKHSL